MIIDKNKEYNIFIHPNRVNIARLKPVCNWFPNSIPSKRKVRKYYGKAVTPAHFNTLPFGRMVFQSIPNPDAFVIVPYLVRNGNISFTQEVIVTDAR